ncbi:heme exporter protein CcmB [Undibacterium amnicola]|uniref:Heme exporter protein B n=1 Tax=Undibacterium amnicola TaxID=1834038 RepID=A0ABR6XTM1_9BURK|nr:heme exporter protein CcmB [Undibacterium amnicola]MBC3832718.1 heme exporter protein CcmB [Undibacterium amnicola]
MWKSFISIVNRDLLLAYRRRSDVLTSLFFFVIVCTLFPLGIGSEIAILRGIAPGIIWVAALLASMLSLHRLFVQDAEDGSLEYLLLSSEPLVVLVLGKLLAHWLIAGLPLLLIAPVLALLFDLPGIAITHLLLALLLGTPSLSLLGGIGAALTLGLRGGGILISLLILPLFIPVLIFGSGAVHADLIGLSAEPYLYLLAAIFTGSLVLSPWLIALALRIHYE